MCNKNNINSTQSDTRRLEFYERLIIMLYLHINMLVAGNQ